ncbi:MAG TPA: DUF4382 domain-containing protein [Saprospiraceae bacterium]|nr:DUF4382 domain-containing protein [Saprospiraceae bacterium]HPI05100.1 DUF4382 domain-containing protein [Saprospiraceae bacterium]
MKVSIFKSAAFAALLLIGFTSCKDDDNTTTGNVAFEVTDGPIDDTNIEGVFVTVASVKVDGEQISDFNGKQTIDLMAYQNGQTKTLGGADLSAGVYSDIRLVLDYDQDASGNTPGTYVLTKDGVKHALKAGASASSEIKVNAATLDVPSSGDVTAVIDFDLRKSVRYNSGSTTSDYQFVTDSELAASTRLAMKSRSGTIKGQVTDALNLSGDKVVVYVYEKGTFTSAETTPQGSSGVMFKNAVTSAVTDSNGNYNLSYLEAGDYELHYVAYDDTDNNSQLEEKGMLVLTVLNGLNLNAITVGAGATVQLNVTVASILPL